MSVIEVIAYTIKMILTLLKQMPSLANNVDILLENFK